MLLRVNMGRIMKFELDRDGYIMKYLVSGRRDLEFHDESRDNNQLRYEKYLRSLVATYDTAAAAGNPAAADIISEEAGSEAFSRIRVGAESPLGMPWRYYVSGGNIFVDDSDFYLEPRIVEMLAATKLLADEDMEVSARLWSYAAVEVWLNGEKAACIEKPVYKPISCVKALFRLKKGENLVYVKLRTLGVRDTSISFAIQIMERRNQIFSAIPDEEGAMPYIRAEELLDSGMLSEGRLFFREELPAGSHIRYFTGNRDFRARDKGVITENVEGRKEILLKKYAFFSVAVPVKREVLERKFERIEMRTPCFLHTPEGINQEAVLEKIGEVASLIRGEEDGFALYPMLARYALGQRKEEDIEEIRVTLKQISRRMDCADFMTCGLIRLMRLYDLGEELKEEIRKTMLDFRYWMDEDGFDGMCFWSENHTLMFYQTAYFFGEEYPDEIFRRSGKTGRQLRDDARKRILEWLRDVLTDGFEEFNSGVYTAITFSVLLNLVDFAEEEIAEKASEAADLILRTIARHCFKNVIISPQGRIYRNVLYPHLQGLQALLQYIVPEAPYVYNEWLSAFAGTRYEIPGDLQEIMGRKGWQSYQSSNAVVDLYRTEDYMLTSVESPRRDGIRRVWEHRMEEAERESFHYVKSLNECFHGTMQFEPGVFGYQQHMWYAALDQDLAVFSNHPGQTCEARGESRPGYWYGNGIMPALRQKDNMLGIIYQIPDTHPIHFIHLFWNKAGFDEEMQEGSWLFGRKGKGCIGIWCSSVLTDHDDMLFNCEKRAYGDRIALVCVCSGEEEGESFSSFKKRCGEMPVSFDEKESTLTVPEFSLHFEAAFNPTQFVE